MRGLAVVAGALLIGLILWEAFSVFVLTRRVFLRFNMFGWLGRLAWTVWKVSGRLIPSKGAAQIWLSFFAPTFILLMLGAWAFGLILGFALLHWGLGTVVSGAETDGSFLIGLYFSGSTFFTLGLGDLTPRSPLARLLTVSEAGMGFAFLALIISYLPPLNQNFIRREMVITLLDARAGSPPTAGELLRRHRGEHGLEALRHLLHEWELWAAEFLEGHMTFPVLAFFRSQHDNQSWLGGLTVILDTSALVMAGLEGACARQAALTFAMARHALVDLSLVFQTPPRLDGPGRMPGKDIPALQASLMAAGLTLADDETATGRLEELRGMYEPFLSGLADYFQMAVPPWDMSGQARDNWQASAWNHVDVRRHVDLGRGHFKGDGG